MLRSIQKLIGDKRKQLIFPIFLMSLDAIGSLVMYLMLYFTVIHLLNGSLTGGLVRNYLNCICRRMDWTFFRKSVRKPGRNIRRCDFNFNRGTDFYYGLTEKNWRNLRNEKIK